MASTIIAENVNNSDIGGGASFISNGNNLIGNGEGASGFTNGVNDDIVGTSTAPIDPKFDPNGLQDNGGPTQTIALLADSPAIDAGSANALTTDQRGEARNQQGGVDIGAFELECFLTGTLIATDQGERPVETLKIGDVVQTADGNLERIKWVGHQTAEPSQVRQPLRGYPIQIKAGALGNNRPHRDLYVSPDHALLVEGLLINAGALVNGTSILRTEPTETFVYHHIELENHTLLIAEGAWAESYLPQKEDRTIYDNGAEYEELYPHGSKLMLWPMDYPRVSSQNKLPRFIRKYLNQVAQELRLTAQIA